MQWRRQLIYKFATFLFIGCLLSGVLQADDREQLEKELNAKYKGSVLTLRKFYLGNTLRYDREGQLTDRQDVGPWTLYGKVEVRMIKVRKEKIELHGNRIFVGYLQNHSAPQFFRSRSTIKIIIEHSATDDQATITRTAIPKIFFSGHTTLADVVPIYWRPFLSGDKQEKNKHTSENQSKIACIACEKDSTDANHSASATAVTEMTATSPPEKWDPVLVTIGVQEPQRIHSVKPRYPKIARSYGWRGTVLLAVIINKTGNITNITIRQAAGMGLDEAAIDAVQQWKYAPAILNGEPVPVFTIIEVIFRME